MQLPPFIPETMKTHPIFVFDTISNIDAKMEFCFQKLDVDSYSFLSAIESFKKYNEGRCQTDFWAKMG